MLHKIDIAIVHTMEEDLMEYAPNIPDNVLELIFSFLKLQDLRNCTLVCKSWYRFFCDENNEVWRAQCLQKVPAEAFKNDLLTVVPTYKAKLRAYFHAWNPFDCSRHVYIKPNGFTLHRNPVAQSTDGSRGKIDLNMAGMPGKYGGKVHLER